MRQVRARTAHEIPGRAPLQLDPGDQVLVGERDERWPSFVWVEAAAGTGWVPARHLSSDHGDADVLVSYDTTELPTTTGELLDVLAEDLESGWLWCRNRRGRVGWVPIETVEEAPASS